MSHDNVLRDIELFADMTDVELDRVRTLATEQKFKRGRYIFMEGQPRDQVYFVQRGLIKVFRVDEEGREQIVSILGAGNMFPHVGFFDDGSYPGTAEALSTTVVLAIRSSKFEELLMTSPEITRKVMRVMGRRILHLQNQLRELALFDSRERVEALLRHFAEEHGTLKSDGMHLHLPVTHSEMAQMIGLSRESVNRILNDLRRSSVLEGDKDEWVLDANWLEGAKRSRS